MLWVHWTPILEVIFVTLTENSSVVTNDTQGPHTTRNIHTTRKSCRETHFHVQHYPKTIPVFLPADREASWLLLPSYAFLLSYYQVVQCNQKNSYFCILKVTGQVWESQKRQASTLITSTTFICLSQSHLI